MRKVSFGSFPLTEIKKEDRKCLDRYLIKTFADNISISDAIRNLAITKNLMYITPDALMRDWMGSKKQRTNRSDRESNSMYESALKRAFYVLREFYSTVSTSPFYKEYVYYPIYIEKVERVTAEGSSRYDSKFTDVTMNYSFIVLSNDLTKGLKIDEIRYDENASLNFLFLFVEFFSGGASKQSIHDFNKQDYEFLVKLYQFTEKSNKEPIQMVLDLYKIIGLMQKIKDSRGARDEASLVGEMDKFLKGIQIGELKRYQGLLRHQFLDMIKRGTADGKSLRKAFEDLMNSIFKSEGLNGLYGEVAADTGRGDRHKHIYNSNKYREILALAGELVKYNALDCQRVITEDSLEIDFKVENNNRTLDVKSGMAAQRYQTFFRDYVDSIKDFFNGMVQDLINQLKIEDIIHGNITGTLAQATSDLALIQKKTAGANRRLGFIQDDSDNFYMSADNAQTVNDRNSALSLAAKADKEIIKVQNEIDTIYLEIKQQEDFIKVLNAQEKSIPSVTKTIGDDVAAELSDHLISSMVTNLTFVYDDGKRFFTNQLIAQGLMDLAATGKEIPAGTPTGHDITTFDGFEKTAKEATTVGTFPKETPEGKINPSFLTAQVTSSLEDAFQIMAQDTMATFDDHIIPILQKHYQSHIQKNIIPPKAEKKPKSWTIFNSTGKDSIAQDRANFQMDMVSGLLERLENNKTLAASKMALIEKDLHENVFRNRFVSKVLKNFLRLFEVKDVKQVIEHDENISQLHPLIKKLLKDGTRCQFFKSFIIEHDMVEQLYRLKYITDTQKFLDGIINIAPKKFNDPMNRMQVVLHDYLGLERNPTWVVSETNVYLSMPDDLSLTNTSILSNIPKVDLMKVCRIDPRDYWRGEKMGEVAKFGNPKVKKLTTDIASLEDQMKDVRDEMKSEGHVQSFGESIELMINDNDDAREILEEANNSNQKKGNNKKGNNKKGNKSGNKSWNNNKKGDSHYKSQIKRLETLQKQIDKKEEEIQRAMSDFEEKDYLPNMSVFDDPYRAEKEEFLSDQEKSELMSNRTEMEDKLTDLNPYDDDDVREMEANQRGIDTFNDEREKEARSHPFDFEEEKDGLPKGPQRWTGDSSREAENEDWLQSGERNGQNEFNDKQDQHGYDRRDRFKQ